MKTCKAKSDRRLFHVKRFDALCLEVFGRCAHAARKARRAALAATLATAAVSCGYSELEMQAMRDKAARLEASVITLGSELQQCKAPEADQ